jgi:hypothetical protein
MDSISPDVTTTPKRLTRGWRRYQELRRQDAADRASIERGLIADLGRAPTMNDRLAIEDIASLTIWARILERRGQFAKAAEIRDQITRTRRTNNIKPEPAAPQKAPDIHDLLADVAASSSGAPR